MVEAPGTAPGSDRFITTAIYCHSRLAPAVPNISAEGCRKKSIERRPGGADPGDTEQRGLRSGSARCSGKASAKGKAFGRHRCWTILRHLPSHGYPLTRGLRDTIESSVDFWPQPRCSSSPDCFEVNFLPCFPLPTGMCYPSRRANRMGVRGYGVRGVQEGTCQRAYHRPPRGRVRAFQSIRIIWWAG